MNDAEYIAAIAEFYKDGPGPEFRAHYERLMHISAAIAAAPAQAEPEDLSVAYFMGLHAAKRAPQPAAQAQDARQPLTEDQIGAIVRAAHIAFCLDKFQTFECALIHFTEQAHGISAQQGDANE